MATGGTPGGWKALNANVNIEAIAAGGSGVGHLADGRVVFVPRTAPGDEVIVEVDISKKRWSNALLVDIVKPGLHRRPAPCVHYARCGGCALQHLEYATQLEAKGSMVREALTRIGGIIVPVEGPQGSPSEWEYRTRATFHLRRLGARAVVAGFHAVGRPGRVVDIDQGCLVLDPTLAEGWKQLRAAWGDGAWRLPAGKELRLGLRVVEDGVVLTIEGGSGRGKVDDLLAEVPLLRAVWELSSQGTPRLLAGDGQVLEGALSVDRLGSGAFTQVNPAAAHHLVDWVLESAGPELAGMRIVDAYAGVGVFGRALLGAGATGVVAVEADPLAATAAEKAGLEVLQGSVEDRLAEALPADLVVVNPPRAGLHPRVTDELDAKGPGRVIYVSCDPATLARDLARLTAYRVARVRTLDMFPQTAHVETLVVLDRISPPLDRPAGTA